MLFKKLVKTTFNSGENALDLTGTTLTIHPDFEGYSLHLLLLLLLFDTA